MYDFEHRQAHRIVRNKFHNLTVNLQRSDRQVGQAGEGQRNTTKSILCNLAVFHTQSFERDVSSLMIAAVSVVSIRTSEHGAFGLVSVCSTKN